MPALIITMLIQVEIFNKIYNQFSNDIIFETFYIKDLIKCVHQIRRSYQKIIFSSLSVLQEKWNKER